MNNAMVTFLVTRWEKRVFTVVGLVAFAMLAIWLWGLLAERAGDQLQNRQSPSQGSLLNPDTAFLFRTPPTNGKMKDPHGFFMVLKVPQQENTSRPWQPFRSTQRPPERKADPPPERKVEPKPTPPPVPPPVVTRTIEYRGCMTTPLGKELALVQDVNSRSTSFLRKGETLGDFTINAFSMENLVITDAKGRESVIAFGKRKKITLD